jgi:hypothetical protein
MMPAPTERSYLYVETRQESVGYIPARISRSWTSAMDWLVEICGCGI